MTAPAGRRESGVESVSKYYSRIPLLLLNCTTIIHPATPWCTKQRRLICTFSVTRILLNNHSNDWKLVVHERCDKPETTKTAMAICFQALYILCNYQCGTLCYKI